MLSRDYRDIVAGVILLSIGVAVTIYATNALPMGRIQRMGPGLFPAALGVILAGFGLAIAVPAFFRPGSAWERIDWRPGICVTAGIAAFALSVSALGMIPAAILLILIAHFAETRLKPVGLAGMLIVLPGLAYLIFRVGLDLPVPMLRWPF